MKGKKGLFSILFGYLNEIVYTLIHIAVFYMIPLKAGESQGAGIIVVQFFITFSLGLMMGGIIRRRKKYLYPVAIAILYMPSALIFNSIINISYCLWIFIASILGVVFGHLSLKPKPLPKKEKSEEAIDEKKVKKQAESDLKAIETLNTLNEKNSDEDSAPKEFDITDSDVVPEVETPEQKGFFKRFLENLKNSSNSKESDENENIRNCGEERMADRADRRAEKRAKKLKSNKGVTEGYDSREVKEQGLKEEFGKDYMSNTKEKLFDVKTDGDESAEEKTNDPKYDDGQKQFFQDEYRREGAFLINHKVAENNNSEVELKTSVTKNDETD